MRDDSTERSDPATKRVPMPIDPRSFRTALGQFAAGVTVVTTVGRDGKPYGLTATAFTSVSLDPPLVLVCIDKGAESFPHLLSAPSFAVSILSAAQVEVSNQFARSGTDKFEGVETRTAVTGAPLISGALVHVDCRTTQRVEAGDHVIFIGTVEAADVFAGDPLLYHAGRYRTLAS